MSHYSDAEDTLDLFRDLPGCSGEGELRRRKGWDLDEAESMASEIKDLLDEDVNSMVSCVARRLYPISLQ